MTTRTDEGWSLSDVEEDLLSVTDVKDYVYCPRVVYFRRVLRARERMGSQQSDARERHVRLHAKEARRRGIVPHSRELAHGEKSFGVRLVSRRLGLQGTLDCLVRIGGEYVPVDYKFTESDRGRVWTHHKYQLVAYAMLVEDNLSTTVRRAYAYYVPEELLAPVPVTQSSREFVKKILTRIRRIVRSEEPPAVRVDPSRCSCGLRWVCGRV